MTRRVDKGDKRLMKRPDPAYKVTYARIKERVKAGLCTLCGHVPVEGKKICSACSQRAVQNNAVSGFRKVLKLHSVGEPAQVLQALSHVVCQDDATAQTVQALMTALQACDYKMFREAK